MPQLTPRQQFRRLFDFRYVGPRTTLIVLTTHVILLIAAVVTVRYSLEELILFQDNELLSRRLSYVVDRISLAESDLNQVRDIVAQQRVPSNLHKRVYTLVYDDTGKLVSASAAAQAWDDVLPNSLPLPAGTTAGEGIHLLSSPTGRIFAYKSATIATQSKTWTIVIGADHDVEQAMTNRLMRLIPMILSFLVFISFFLAWLMNQSAIKPLRQLTAHVASVRSVAKDPILIPETLYPIDFRGLVQHYNSMLKRLHGSYSRVASFTSDIAHELRTPLNNLMGEIDVALSKPRDAGEYEQLLMSNREEVERLRAIVTSLLKLSQTGTIEPDQLESMSLSAELHKIYEYFSSLADEAHIHLEIESSPDCKISAQRTLFQQALGNLVSNAIKFTPAQGQITIRFERCTFEPGFAKIQVEDSGTGIPENDLQSIFNRFYKVDQARSSRVGGTGLGLAIVKNIVERHQGKIDVASQIGKGSCFTIYWPLSGE